MPFSEANKSSFRYFFMAIHSSTHDNDKKN